LFLIALKTTVPSTNVMKRTINCDQVFEILTRGPFPSGDPNDAAVELHLLACHECRELAEALRPPVNLFHESMPFSQHVDLPGYSGALCRSDDGGANERQVALALSPKNSLPQILRRAVRNHPALKSFVGAVAAAGLLFAFVSLAAIGDRDGIREDR